MSNRQALQCGIAEPPWLRACRATAEQEDTHSTQGTGTSMLEKWCGTALAECTWLCLTLRCNSDLFHWQILEPITTPHSFHCSHTWCKHRGGEARQDFHRFRKGKGIPVCHTWRPSAFQSSWEGTTLTGRPIARLKSRKPKGSSSFPDAIKAANPGL